MVDTISFAKSALDLYGSTSVTASERAIIEVTGRREYSEEIGLFLLANLSAKIMIYMTRGELAVTLDAGQEPYGLRSSKR